MGAERNVGPYDVEDEFESVFQIDNDSEEFLPFVTLDDLDPLDRLDLLDSDYSDDSDYEELDILDSGDLQDALDDEVIGPNDFVNDMSILCYVVQEGAERSVEILMHAGADPDTRCRLGNAVDIAVISGRADIAELLLESGTLPGVTPDGLSVNIAAERGNWKMALLASEYGYDINTEDAISGETAFSSAITYSSGRDAVDMLRAFHYAGVHVNHRNPRNGVTPLMLAARTSNLALVRSLMRRGADHLAVDSNGSTASSYASTPGVRNYLLTASAHSASD